MKPALIPLGVALMLSSAARADFNPLPLTSDSYNQDVVVEKTGPAALVPGGYTTASMDQGIANGADTWSEQGYFREDTSVGLPPAGTSFTATNDNKHTYQMAPSYTANDAIMLDSTYFTNVYTWTVATPRACSGLSFMTSGGNGGCQFRWTAHHQDGSTDTGTAASPDWFFVNNPPRAWTANVRVNAQNFNRDNYNSDNPRLYEVDVIVGNSTSPITSIDIQFVSSAANAHSAILAISGGTGGSFTPLSGTGYNADIIVEASAPERADLTQSGVVTATMDGGTAVTGDTWYEQGLAPLVPNTGIPQAGSTFSATNAPDHHFTMPASYAGNDALMLDTTTPNATITLATPTALAGLSFLTASAGGTINIEADIHHQDGSIETNILVAPDWFGGSAVAWTANGRLNIPSSLIDNLNSNNPRLYYSDIALNDTTSPVTSIDLNFTATGGRSAIFAVSGTTQAVKPLFVIQPQPTQVNLGGNATLTAIASGTGPVSYQWQKGTNGVFVNIGSSAVNQTNLTLTSVTDADWADYRAIASNAGGSATSTVATVTVLSTLSAITKPTDSIVAYQPRGGGSPDAENVTHAIDSNTSKYLNSANGVTPMSVPVGFVVTPSMGPTFLSVIRFYTANDAPERDPANYIVEGSNDGGATYALIASNSLALPDGRNAGGQALAPTTQYLTQVRISSPASYTTYRVYFTRVKGNSNLMQIGEVEMLGTADTTGRPYFSGQPTAVTVYDGTSASFTVAPSGTPTPAVHWLKGTNGVYVPLSDGGHISGSQTGTLTINPASFGDIADYVAVASNANGTVQSAPASLNVLVNLSDVLNAADPITHFGDTDGASNFWGTASAPVNAIDSTTTKYQNGGHNFSADAGFGPFVGPVGVIVTPSAGPTVVKALRLFTADGNPERDPADYTLEGSSDGGAHWTLISAGALNLPDARNAANVGIDPLTEPLQEVRFLNNNFGFTSYRLTFNHTRDDNAANSLQFAEMQLPGYSVTTASSGVTVNRSGNTLTLTSAMGGTLQSTTDFVTWTDVQPVTANVPVNITISPSTQKIFYRIKAQ